MKARSNAFPPGVSLRALRVAFLSLGIALLTSLFALYVFMQRRLDEARVEREQMVSSRVFDELEREISSFLDGESERAPYASLHQTNSASWAPFVIGYFKRDLANPEVVTRGGADSENHRRVNWALNQTKKGMAEIILRIPVKPKPTEEAQRTSGKLSPSSDPPSVQPKSPSSEPKVGQNKKSSSGSDIIQRLNRAEERRKLPIQSNAPSAAGKSEDQFLDYTESY